MWKANRIRRIDLELTSYCNIKCSGCTRETAQSTEFYLNKKENMLSLEMIKEKFRQEDWPALKTINFCGSIDEPTSHPEFFEIVKFFIPWKINISISTNGSIRTPKWWGELAQILNSSHHSVLWGVDGTDETSEIYRKGSNFKKVQENWRAFHKFGGRSIWQFIIMEHNKHQVDDLERIAEEEGFKAVKFINSMRSKGDVEYVKPEVEESEEVECKYLRDGTIFINCKGDVIPCCYMNAEHLEASKPNYHNGTFPQRQAYVDLWREHGEQLATNLRYNEIVDVIEGDFFDSIAESWTQKPLFDRCENYCKKKKQSQFDKRQIKK